MTKKKVNTIDSLIGVKLFECLDAVVKNTGTATKEIEDTLEILEMKNERLVKKMSEENEKLFKTDHGKRKKK